MGKACTAAKAYFLFKPICGNCKTADELDALSAVIRNIVESNAGTMAKFYLFNPCFDLADGSFELIIYRDEYVKKYPSEFGLKRKQVQSLDGPLPEEFAAMTFKILQDISYISELRTQTSYELFDVDEDGDDTIAASGSLIMAPDDCDEEYDEFDEDSDGFDDEFGLGNFGEYESYSCEDDDDEDDYS